MNFHASAVGHTVGPPVRCNLPDGGGGRAVLGDDFAPESAIWREVAGAFGAHVVVVRECVVCWVC